LKATLQGTNGRAGRLRLRFDKIFILRLVED
jgi:hypothetical protein